MTAKTWIGGTGDWSTAVDWSPRGVPGPIDDAVLGAGAAVAIAAGETVGSAYINVIAPTASLTVDGVLQYATVVLGGGQLTGTGMLDEDTIWGTLTTSALTVENLITLQAASGLPCLVVTTTGGTITGVGTSVTYLDGGVALVGSSDLTRPVVFQDNSGQFTLQSQLDVTGAVVLKGSGPGADAGNIVSLDTVNLAPGGDLMLQGMSTLSGPVHIEGGTLDTSAAASGLPAASSVSFDGSSGMLVLKDGQAVQVGGFRAGDTIDVKGVSVSGPLSPGSGYTITVGATQFALQTPAAPGATYTAAPDGNSGTLITTTAEPVATVAFADQTTGTAGSYALAAAVGGPSYLRWQSVEPSTDADTIAMTATVPNVFLKGGCGTKALSVTSGQNVLDGGSGSAFLTGGSGTDTFFVGLQIGAWDTISNFHAGDAVTVWGWVPGVSYETVDPLAGAAGHQGATLGFYQEPDDLPMPSSASKLTFAGLTADQVAHLQTSTGTAGGVSYLYLYNPGV